MIGRRSNQIQIIKNALVQDPGGGTSYVKESYWNTSAEIVQLKGTRVAESFQDALRPVFSIIIRWRKDKHIDDSMTVSINGKEHVIHTIDNVKLDNQYIELIVIGNQ